MCKTPLLAPEDHKQVDVAPDTRPAGDTDVDHPGRAEKSRKAGCPAFFFLS